MALRMGALYDALLSAQGVNPDLASKAAEEVAGYDPRIASIESDLLLLKWMVATLIAFTLGFGFGNLWLSFNILSRLPK